MRAIKWGILVDFDTENIVRFPTLLMEDIIKVAGYPYEWLRKFVNLYIFSMGGKYVWTTYLCVIKSELLNRTLFEVYNQYYANVGTVA